MAAQDSAGVKSTIRTSDGHAYILSQRARAPSSCRPMKLKTLGCRVAGSMRHALPWQKLGDRDAARHCGNRPRRSLPQVDPNSELPDGEREAVQDFLRLI